MLSFSNEKSEITSDTNFGFTIFPAILFSINSPVALAISWTNFLEAVFAASIFVLLVVFNNFFVYLLDRFLANDKNPYPLTYALVVGCIEYLSFLFINRQSQISFVFYF